ncbi:MAG: hypothetical protein JWN79_305 [Gemmatimonadetes bacterium]|jgi:hypothetical protein|nr:hypothetical protein [Gemmatimonadota bacterium]
MASDNKTEGLGDGQGTRVGAPDQSTTATPAKHSDSPSSRPERATGTGSEATLATDGSAEGHTNEHRSGYGGKGGEADRPSDKR